MKMLYVVNTKHDAAAYRAYAKVHLAARATTGTKVFAAIVGALMVGGGIVAAVNQGPKFLYLLSIVAGVLIACFQPIGLWRMQRHLTKNARDLQMTIDYRFADTCFDVTYPGQSESIPYGQLQKIVETPGYYFLYTDVRMAHILPKKDFTMGDAAGFSAFLASKASVPVTKMDA